jgi:hypothetical protein
MSATLQALEVSSCSMLLAPVRQKSRLPTLRHDSLYLSLKIHGAAHGLPSFKVRRRNMFLNKQ